MAAYAIRLAYSGLPSALADAGLAGDHRYLRRADAARVSAAGRHDLKLGRPQRSRRPACLTIAATMQVPTARNLRSPHQPEAR